MRGSKSGSKARAQCYCLTWENDIPHPYTAPKTVEGEALAAMNVLAGFRCAQCGKLLSEKNGYVCCAVVHCPLCGATARSGWAYLADHCKHLVLWESAAGLRLQILYANGVPTSIRERAETLLNLTAPAAPVRGHRGTEYPVWSATQIVDAFGLNLTPIITRVFGRDLRELDQDRLNRTLLEACLHPDRKTTTFDRDNRLLDYYFCSDPDAALSRVIAWAEVVAEGTQRLRAMTPKRIVQG